MNGSERAKMIDHYVEHYVNRSLEQELDFATIRGELAEAGVPKDAADLIVRFVDEALVAIAANGGSKKSFLRNEQLAFILGGGLILGIGLFITISSLNAAREGGSFVIAYGAILGGISAILTGLVRGRKKQGNIKLKRRFR